MTTSLTDGLVVVTNRVEQERDALAVRRSEGNNTNHGWENSLLVVLCTRYLTEISEPSKCFGVAYNTPLKIAKGCVCALVHWRPS
jgi:hypothetical protein